MKKTDRDEIWWAEQRPPKYHKFRRSAARAMDGRLARAIGEFFRLQEASCFDGKDR